MNLSALTLQKLVMELQPALTRRLIRDAFLGAHHDLYFDLSDAGFLLLSARPGQSRIAFSSPPAEETRTRLSWVDRYLLKAGIVSLSQWPHERVIEFVIHKKDRLGGTSQSRLICEMIGRYTNVILVDHESNQILGALRQVSHKQNRVREIMPGRPYAPPPALNRLSPETVTPDILTTLFQDTTDSPEGILTKHIAGIDTLTARELFYLAPVSMPPQPNELSRLAKTIQTFFAHPPFISGATLLTDKDGKKTICVYQTQHVHPEHTFVSVGEAVETLLSVENALDTLRSRKKNTEGILQHQLATIARKKEHILSDLQDAEFADQYEKWGNILMANIPRIPPGAKSVSLPDLFNPSAPKIDILLNSNRTPAENAQDYLKRGRKTRKGAPILGQRLNEVQNEIDTLQTLLDRLQQIQNDTQLETFRSQLEKTGLIKIANKNTPKTKKRAEGDIHPRRYRTSDGWSVLVGRNNQENDKLTKSAAKNDIFLHAHGCPGSHVILKRDGKIDNPSRNTLKEAASLAAYWSKARGAKTVPVSYTEVRYVHKPKGAPAGLVTIKNEKTIMAEPVEITREDEV